MQESSFPGGDAPGATPSDRVWRREYTEELDSTQDELKRRLRRGEAVDGVVLRAGAQTAGRGRRGDPWRSPPGGCYQTVAVEQSALAFSAPGFTLAVGVCLAEELRRRGVECLVKWPNDLYVSDLKLGGVLVESVRQHLLVGTGINVANEPPAGGTALAGWAVEAVAELAFAAVVRALRSHALARGGSEVGLRQRFARMDWLAGKRVSVGAATTEAVSGRRPALGADSLVHGVASGIDESGCLLVTEPGGALVRVHSGTVRSYGRGPAD